MTTCIKCGKPIPDGELFCRECSLNLDHAASAAARPVIPAAQGRMQTPAPQARAPREAAPKAPAAPAPKRQSHVLTIVACVLAVLGIGLAAWQFAGTTRRQRSLRVWEENLSERERQLDTLQTQIDDLTQELQEAEDNASAQARQIEELLNSVSSAQSSANQSQYDLTEQQKELAQAVEEKAALKEQAASLEDELNALQTEYETLESRYARQQEKVKFMDSYVVFVEDDGTGKYHRYDCAKFLKKNFWAYSRKLAEKQGYSPCSDCFGG